MMRIGSKSAVKAQKRCLDAKFQRKTHRRIEKVSKFAKFGKGFTKSFVIKNLFHILDNFQEGQLVSEK